MKATGKTISSRVIAEEIGMSHPRVKKNVEEMLTELGLEHGTFKSTYLTALNKEHKQYLLPQKEAMMLGCGYGMKVMEWIIDYFLEDQNTKELTYEEMVKKEAPTSMERIAVLEKKNISLWTKNESLRNMNKEVAEKLYAAREEISMMNKTVGYLIYKAEGLAK